MLMSCWTTGRRARARVISTLVTNNSRAAGPDHVDHPGRGLPLHITVAPILISKGSIDFQGNITEK